MTRRDDLGKGHSRYRECYWLEDDVRAFSDILRDAFPGLLICKIDYENESMQAFDNIVDARKTGDFDKDPLVILPEPGWEPKFHFRNPKNFPDLKSLANLPDRYISIRQSELRELDLADIASRRRDDEKWYNHRFVSRDGKVVVERYDVWEEMDPEVKARRRYIEENFKPPAIRVRYLDGLAHMQSYYHDGQPEVKSFVAKVFRLMGKFMTNSLEVIDLHTREVIEVDHGSILWSGPDVVRRCREEENFFLYFDNPESRDYRWIGAKAIPKPVKPKRRRRAS